MLPLAQFELKIGEHALLKKNNTKYLGVIIDQDLNWHVHIENVIKQLAGAAKILCKIRHYVDKKTLVNLYYAFAYPREYWQGEILTELFYKKSKLCKIKH